MYAARIEAIACGFMIVLGIVKKVRGKCSKIVKRQRNPSNFGKSIWKNLDNFNAALTKDGIKKNTSILLVCLRVKKNNKVNV